MQDKENYFEFYMKLSKGKSGIKIRSKKKTMGITPSMKNKSREELNGQQDRQQGGGGA